MQFLPLQWNNTPPKKAKFFIYIWSRNNTINNCLCDIHISTSMVDVNTSNIMLWINLQQIYMKNINKQKHSIAVLVLVYRFTTWIKAATCLFQAKKKEKEEKISTWNARIVVRFSILVCLIASVRCVHYLSMIFKANVRVIRLRVLWFNFFSVGNFLLMFVFFWFSLQFWRHHHHHHHSWQCRISVNIRLHCKGIIYITQKGKKKC